MSEPSRGVAYVDTSALVKLVIRETESDALENALSTWRGVATRSIPTIELQRAAQRARADDREGVADDATIAVLLAAVAQIPLSPLVRQTAATLHPVELRPLDAIQLASALALGNDLASVVTYDQRMAAAANALGLQASAPPE